MKTSLQDKIYIVIIIMMTGYVILSSILVMHPDIFRRQPEPEPAFVPSEFAELLVDAYYTADIYDRDSGAEGVTYSSGSGVTVMVVDDTMGIVAIHDGRFIVLEYTLKTRFISRNVQVHFEWAALHDGSRFLEVEAWGASINPDDYILLETNMEETIALFEKLTPEEVHYIASKIG